MKVLLESDSVGILDNLESHLNWCQENFLYELSLKITSNQLQFNQYYFFNKQFFLLFQTPAGFTELACATQSFYPVFQGELYLYLHINLFESNSEQVGMLFYNQKDSYILGISQKLGEIWNIKKLWFQKYSNIKV